MTTDTVTVSRHLYLAAMTINQFCHDMSITATRLLPRCNLLVATAAAFTVDVLHYLSRCRRRLSLLQLPLQLGNFIVGRRLPTED